MSLDNANPIIYERTKERERLPEDEDDDVVDEIDDREVFGSVTCVFQRLLINNSNFNSIKKYLILLFKKI